MVVAIMLAALAVAGCGSGDSSGAGAGKAEMLRIADAVAAAGAQRTGDLLWYESENLYEYINGAAAAYTDAGFVRLLHSEWRSAGGKEGAYVELDVYDMGTPLGALDILADARTPQTQYLPLGNEAHQSDDGIDLRVGRYYVKLVARRDIEGQREFLKAIAAAVAKAAPPGPADEKLVEPMPTTNLVPHSVAYTSRNFLGRECLQKVREASYEVQGKRVRLFLMDAGTPEKAKTAITEWKESLPPQPIGASDLPNTMSYNEEYVGAVTAMCHDKWVAGSIGDPAVAQPILNSLLKRLE
jgi:hypothetical protein